MGTSPGARSLPSPLALQTDLRVPQDAAPTKQGPKCPSPGGAADSPNNSTADKTLQPHVPFPGRAHCGPSASLVLGDGWGLEELGWAARSLEPTKTGLMSLLCQPDPLRE